MAKKSVKTEKINNVCYADCKPCNYGGWLWPLVILAFVWIWPALSWGKWMITAAAVIMLVGNLCPCRKQ